MSNEEIKALEQEERAAMQRLEALREQKRKAIDEHNKKLAEEKLSKPVEIVVSRFDGAMVVTESSYREDLLGLLRATPGRAYRGDKFNLIPAGVWYEFLLKASQLRNVTIKYNDGVQEKIDRHLNAPVWEISLDRNWIRCVPGPQAERYKLGNIPGADWNTQGEFYRIPLSEAHRLPIALQDIDGVVWDEDAQKLVFEQHEKRARLDQIGQLKVSERFVDFDLNGMRLMPFQTVGVEFMDCANGRMMLCDEMGLGKTPQALAFSWYKKFRTVIVCPASLIPNWVREIRKFTGQSAYICIGVSPTEYDMKSLLIDPPQYVIINYEILRRKTVETKTSGLIVERYLWANLLNLSKPELLIVDEGHYIKDVDAAQSRAVRSLIMPNVIFLTGTPVINRPGELWPMLTMVAPESFPAFETFMRQYTYDGRRPRNVEELRSALRHLMLRRLKKDVLADLPKLQRITKFYELSPKAQKLYQKILDGIYEQLAEWNPQGETSFKKVNNMLVRIGRLKQICAYDSADFTADLATQLYDQTDESEHRKVIIFTQYKAVCYGIYQRLAEQGALSFVDRTPTEFKTVDGAERDRRVQQFQTDPNIKYLVVTEKTTKEGHNITAAGHVIFNDLFWTPAGHDQAIGRAYARLSDLHGVDAYFTIAQLPDIENEKQSSIADWNWELLGFKQGVINATIEGVHEETQSHSIQMEIIERLKEAMWTRKKK